MKIYIKLLLVLVACCLSGCDSGPKSSKGFSLPEGDVKKGKATFVSLGCTHCHKVSGVAFETDEDEMEMSIKLGGEVSRIKTYGELVSSIINPSHRFSEGYAKEEIAVDGESKMQNYNEVMTVQQLVDLVAFLQSRYRLIQYETTDYPPFLY